MSEIAIVVPTIRPEKYKRFLKAWKKDLDEPNIRLITIWDGENPAVGQTGGFFNGRLSLKEVMGKDSDLIYNFNDGVRNLGFAFIAKYCPTINYIVTLDDDTEPSGDTIRDHIKALNMRVPISWVSTQTEYTRGFPYGVREEAEVVLSHGNWEGVKDWDAPTQLVKGNPEAFPFVGPIPKGVFYPMCGMNIAFKRKLLPYMYFAPMGPRVGLDRFGDIWAGIETKKVIDKKGWAVITGMAEVKHKRASNVYTNLIKEAKGLQMNENYGEGDYFNLYEKQRKRWKNIIQSLDSSI